VGSGACRPKDATWFAGQALVRQGQAEGWLFCCACRTGDLNRIRERGLARPSRPAERVVWWGGLGVCRVGAVIADCGAEGQGRAGGLMNALAGFRGRRPGRDSHNRRGGLSWRPRFGLGVSWADLARRRFEQSRVVRPITAGRSVRAISLEGSPRTGVLGVRCADWPRPGRRGRAPVQSRRGGRGRRTRESLQGAFRRGCGRSGAGTYLG